MTTDTDFNIRPVNFDEYDLLAEVERSAAQRFNQVGLTSIAQAEPTDTEFIGTVAAFGGAFVAALPEDDMPVGFILVGMLDRAAHIYELSVAEEHGRQGIGRLLIEEASRYAGAEGVTALTLSTFQDVPWNGPFYEQLGFRYLTRAEWTPALHILRKLEKLHGLPMERRAFMRWDAE